MGYYPTVHIGLGQTGECVLWHLKRLFQTYCFQALEQDVRFLWVGLQDCDEKIFNQVTCVRLTGSERIQLESLTDQSRQGAQALFWKYQYEQNQPGLDNFIVECQKNLMHGNLNSYRVFIFSAMDEPESGFVSDLAVYLRQRAAGMNYLTPWLFQAGLAAQGNQSNSTSSWPYAMTRELELMMQPEFKVWGSHPDPLTNKIQQRALFDNIFLFGEDTIVPAVAQTAFSFIGRTVSQNKVNPTVISGRGNLQVATVSSYAIGLPKNKILEYAKAHVLFHSMFSESEPDIPDGIFSSQRPIHRELILRDIETFFLQVGPPLNLIPNIKNRRRISWGEDIDHAIIASQLTEFINDRSNTIIQRKEDLHPLFWVREFLLGFLKYISDKTIIVSNSSMRSPQKQSLLKVFEKFKNLCDQYFLQAHEATIILNNIKKTLKEKMAQSQSDIVVQSWKTELIEVNNQLISDRVIKQHYAASGEQAYDHFLTNLRLFWDTGQSKLNLSVNGISYPLDRENQVSIEENLLDSPANPKLIDQVERLTVNNFITQELQQRKAKQALIESIKVPLSLTFSGGNSIKREYFVQCHPLRSNSLREYFSGSYFSNHFKNEYYSDFNTLIYFYEQVTGIGIKDTPVIANSRKRYQLSTRGKGHVMLALKTASDYESKIEQVRKHWEIFFDRDDVCIPNKFEFSPHFARLMANPQHFAVVMKMIYFDWLKKIRGSFVIEYPQERIDLTDNHTAPRIEEPETYEQALENILFRFPYESMNNVHPLFRTKYSKTMDRIKVEISDFENQLSKEELEEIEGNLIKSMQSWETASDRFSQDMSVFMYYLIRKRHC
jgi:hypothetical protein